MLKNTILHVMLIFMMLVMQSCIGSKKNQFKDFSRIISIKPYKVGNKWYQPILMTKEFRQKGVASWYGQKFHGGKTSNGEIFNMYNITAAHKTLPFNSWVRVRNLSNNCSINVRINDRGPFVKNRVIDLSYAAAEKIGLIEKGTGEVEITYLGEKRTTKQGVTYIRPIYQSSSFSLQIGSFSKIESVEKIKNKISTSLYKLDITLFHCGKKAMYRVTLCGFPTFQSAVEYQTFLKKIGITDTLVVSGEN